MKTQSQGLAGGGKSRPKTSGFSLSFTSTPSLNVIRSSNPGHRMTILTATFDPTIGVPQGLRRKFLVVKPPVYMEISCVGTAGLNNNAVVVTYGTAPDTILVAAGETVIIYTDGPDVSVAAPATGAVVTVTAKVYYPD